MVKRSYWINLIEDAWKRKTVIWLSGVRRVGKTKLCQSLDDIHFYDCELPSIRSKLDDPEFFLSQHENKRIALDEIHRLQNASEVLKIAADHFPTVKVIATGSSTLGASSHFSDTLSGRKENITLTPMLNHESKIFNNTTIEHRLIYGGLPPHFIANLYPERAFAEWLDAYWAKDIQTLFRLEKRHSFQKMIELLLINSGQGFEANYYARPCEISRTTVSNYLAVLESTHLMHVIRPYNTFKSSEIVSQPKVYGFDTGFVATAKGWQSLTSEQNGLLFEHIVLNEMLGQLQTNKIFYWRDKQKHEIDFIYPTKNKGPTTVECKLHAKNFKGENLTIFRKKYPEGENFVVSLDTINAYQKKFKGNIVTFVNVEELINLIHS